MLGKMPVKVRNVLSTLEQIKREAKRSVRIVIVGSQSVDKDKLQNILHLPSSGAQGVCSTLNWDDAKTKDWQDKIKKADAVLIVLDAMEDLEDQVRKAQQVMKKNSSHLIVIDKVDHVPDLEIRLKPIESFLDRLIGKVVFISTSRDINVEDELAGKVFELLHSKGKGIALASKVILYRRLATAKVIHQTSMQNGMIGLVTILPGADMPILTANQLKMVLKIAAIYDQELSLSRLKEIIAVVGTGFTLRSLARQFLDLVPGIGWVIKGAVAFVGTEAVGQAAQKYFEKGYSQMKKEDIKEIFSGIQGEGLWKRSKKD